MPKENHFEVEYAKSSMATCRVCMAKIPKGSLRIGHVQADLPGDTTREAPLENDATAPAPDGAAAHDRRAAAMAGAIRWHHFECFPRMKGASWMAKNLPADPAALNGFGAIKKADQKRISSVWKALLGAGGGAPASAAAASGKKRKAGEAAPAGAATRSGKDAAGAAKLARLTSVQGVLTAKVFGKVQKLEQQLQASTAAQLQAELARNSQVRSGKKEELVQRVAEGRALGALPGCPKCERGQIHWSRIGGWYSCPGYFDGDAGVQKRCFFRSQDVKRGKWTK
mmetsp:Transcript_64500/g.181456  ORF Transcript_64500/g.181456 Transcript_64500/m.181456 type:complete len:283 (+) Transcript_64500:159-1007(+)